MYQQENRISSSEEKSESGETYYIAIDKTGDPHPDIVDQLPDPSPKRLNPRMAAKNTNAGYRAVHE